MTDDVHADIYQTFEGLRDEPLPRDIPRLQERIAGLILRTLPDLQAAGSYWAKINLADSCRHFFANVRSNAAGAASDAWLRPCLVALDKALLPAGSYNEDYCPRDAQIDRMGFDELARLVRTELAPFAT